MQISFVAPSSTESGAVVVGVVEGGALAGPAVELDKATGGALKRALGTNRFSGKAGQLLDIVAPSGVKASRILLLGIGKASAFDGPAAERAAASVVGKLFTSGEKEMPRFK